MGSGLPPDFENLTERVTSAMARIMWPNRPPMTSPAGVAFGRGVPVVLTPFTGGVPSSADDVPTTAGAVEGVLPASGTLIVELTSGVYDPTVTTCTVRVAVSRGDGQSGVTKGAGRIEIVPPWGVCIPLSAGWYRIEIGGSVNGTELVPPPPVTLAFQTALAPGMAVRSWGYPFVPANPSCNGPIPLLATHSLTFQPNRFSRRWSLTLLSGSFTGDFSWMVPGQTVEFISYILTLTAATDARFLLAEETLRAA